MSYLFYLEVVLKKGCVILSCICHRHLLEGDHDPRFNSTQQGLMPVAEANSSSNNNNNNNSLLKQVLPSVLKFHI